MISRNTLKLLPWIIGPSTRGSLLSTTLRMVYKDVCSFSKHRSLTTNSSCFLNSKENGTGSKRIVNGPKRRKLVTQFSSNPLKRDFGRYEVVLPMEVSEQRTVPDFIKKPEYHASGFIAPVVGKVEPEIKSKEQIQKLRDACALAREVLNLVLKEAKEGVTTEELDKYFHDLVISRGAYPSSLNYSGFPKSMCTSVNNVACHGIPDSRPLKDGDIINIDVMVYYNGYHGDCSETAMIGNVDMPGRELVETAKACLYEGIRICGPGIPFSAIGKAIESFAEEKDFTVVPAFTGHGIGNYVHGPPDIYHIDYPYPGTMKQGNTFTIEPVITQGMENIVILEDGWTAVTVDEARTAQFEHTVLITDSGVEILTL